MSIQEITLGEKALLQEVLYAVKNLINSEEHLAETAKKASSEKDMVKFTKLMDAVRLVRQKLVNLFFPIKNLGDEKARSEHGEVWCSIKHHLSVSIHLIEVAQKLARAGKYDKCKEIYKIMKENDQITDALISTFLFGGGDDDGE